MKALMVNFKNTLAKVVEKLQASGKSPEEIRTSGKEIAENLIREQKLVTATTDKVKHHDPSTNSRIGLGLRTKRGDAQRWRRVIIPGSHKCAGCGNTVSANIKLCFNCKLTRDEMIGI